MRSAPCTLSSAAARRATDPTADPPTDAARNTDQIAVTHRIKSAAEQLGVCGACHRQSDAPEQDSDPCHVPVHKRQDCRVDGLKTRRGDFILQGGHGFGAAGGCQRMAHRQPAGDVRRGERRVADGHEPSA